MKIEEKIKNSQTTIISSKILRMKTNYIKITNIAEWRDLIKIMKVPTCKEDKENI